MGRRGVFWASPATRSCLGALAVVFSRRFVLSGSLLGLAAHNVGPATESILKVGLSWSLLGLAGHTVVPRSSRHRVFPKNCALRDSSGSRCPQRWPAIVSLLKVGLSRSLLGLADHQYVSRSSRRCVFRRNVHSGSHLGLTDHDVGPAIVLLGGLGSRGVLWASPATMLGPGARTVLSS